MRPEAASMHVPFSSAWTQHSTTGFTISLLGIVLYLALSACAMSEPSQAILNSGRSQTTIQLDKTLHFPAPDGTTILVAPDQYLVEQTVDNQLRLVPDKGGSPMIVAADKGTHNLEVSAPFPLVIALNDDARNVVLLMPDGTALDASGSLSGVQSRDIVRLRRHYQLAYQLNPATGQVEFGDGAIGRRPPAGQSSVSSNYRVGAGASGNPSASSSGDSELSMIQLQSLLSDRQAAEALARNILASQNEHFHLEYNTNRPGGDFGQRATVSPEACRMICSADGTCQAFTFAKPPSGVSAGQCYLKRTVPTSVGDGCCISAKRKSAAQEVIGNIR